MNWNIWIPSIVAVAAITSPVITTLINNRNQVKLKKMEFEERAARQMLLDLIEAAVEAANYNSNKNNSNYYSCLNKLQVYFPRIDESLILQLNNGVENEKIEMVNNSLHAIISSINSKN